MLWKKARGPLSVFVAAAPQCCVPVLPDSAVLKPLKLETGTSTCLPFLGHGEKSDNAAGFAGGVLADCRPADILALHMMFAKTVRCRQSAGFAVEFRAEFRFKMRVWGLGISLNACYTAKTPCQIRSTGVAHRTRSTGEGLDSRGQEVRKKASMSLLHQGPHKAICRASPCSRIQSSFARAKYTIAPWHFQRGRQFCRLCRPLLKFPTPAALLGYVFPKKLPDEIVHHGRRPCSRCSPTFQTDWPRLRQQQQQQQRQQQRHQL